MTDISLDIILLALRLNGLLLLVVAFSGWQRRPAPGSGDFALLMAAAAYWSLTYAAGLSVDGLENKLLLNQIMYAAIVFIPVFWLFFAIRYTGTAPLSSKVRLAFCIIPVITMVMIWTNAQHHLFWSNITLKTEGVITSIENTRGAWFWVHTSYSYVCLMTGAYLLLRSLASGRSNLYLGQAVALAIGVFAPWVANAAFIFELVPIRLLDPTPFGFTLTGISISWALYRFKLLDMLPAARDVVLASMTDGVVVLDARNRIVELNPTAENFLREGNPSIQQFVGADANKVLAQWPHIIERFQDVKYAYATAVPFTFRNRTRYIDIRISPIRDGAGTITGRVLVTSDVTPQKLTTDLQKAKETAEASSLAKSAFLASMSHELRTPLNHIIGYSELLEEEMQAQGHTALYADDLRKIRTSGRHLLGIITQILELAKLEAKMVTLSPEIFVLSDLIDDVLTQVNPLAEKNGTQLKSIFSDERIKIHADLAKVRQILHHVIHNAARFTLNGQVEVEATTKDNQVFVEVRDTGPGIAPERLETIFEAFNNPESVKRKKDEQLGLGLATAQQLSLLMQGKITVNSQLGKGSTFVIQLPVGKI